MVIVNVNKFFSTSNAALTQVENTVIVEINYRYSKSPSTTTSSSSSTTTSPPESQSNFYFLLNQFSSCNYFIYSDKSADNFYAPAVHGEFLCCSLRLWLAWLVMVPVFAHPVLATPTRAFVPARS